jgi:glycosyltransferase involved in cell wall biosynthesis
MKVGFFCNEYPPRPHGGIGTFVGMLAQALAKAGHEVTVVQHGSQAFSESLNGVRVVTLKESHTKHIAWLINRIRLWQWLRRAARAGDLEIFEIPEYQGCLPFPVRGCPVVVRLHLSQSHVEDTMNPGSARWQTYWLEKLTLFWHRRWIAVSRYILHETRQFFAIEPTKAQVIYNPAPTIIHEDLPKLFNCPARYVVYVGSVSERKGAILLAKAMTGIFTLYPDVSLVYVGPETEFRGALISKTIGPIVGESNLARVHFTGHLSREYAMAWLRDALVLAFVSRVESFGLVAVEAMSLGVPVIFGNCGPGPEVINNDVDGILVDLDSQEELEMAIRSVLDEPDRARKMSQAGLCKVNACFAERSCVVQSLEFYRDTVDFFCKVI